MLQHLLKFSWDDRRAVQLHTTVQNFLKYSNHLSSLLCFSCCLSYASFFFTSYTPNLSSGLSLCCPKHCSSSPQLEYFTQQNKNQRRTFLFSVFLGNLGMSYTKNWQDAYDPEVGDFCKSVYYSVIMSVCPHVWAWMYMYVHFTKLRLYHIYYLRTCPLLSENIMDIFSFSSLLSYIFSHFRNCTVWMFHYLICHLVGLFRLYTFFSL